VLAAARKNGFEDLSYAAVARAPDQPELNGLTMADAAERLFGSKTAADQARAATELMIRAKGAKVAMVYHGLCDDDVRTFLKVPWIAIASDSGVKTDAPSRPHPRGFGNNPRVLGHYVRAGVLPLAEAVAKMTSRPAATFGIKERGIVREGWFADLVVFDPATIADRATYADPFAEPAGIAKVIVNGTVVVDDGRHTKLRSGAVLRHVRDR
jgi:N-acyl-D-amino-acid deacylase